MGIFEEAAIFRGVTKEDARQMLNCLNPVEKTYKKDEIIYHAGDEVTLSRVRAVMEELAVLPQAQGMGIGTALLYASEAEAKRSGAESLELMVWAFNKSAMRFYESAGMTVRSLVMEKKL